MSDSRTIDQESRRIHEELLENILVEAGAGSGKTQMLAERMAAGITAGTYQVEQMAAVTFTRRPRPN
jgi:ATP-dependent helicase/nuclease subunit A